MSFNGAATFRLRKAGACGAAEGGRPASMGPQPFGCGRASASLFGGRGLWLQWGRNLSVAEGAIVIKIAKVSTSLQWGRNLSVAEGANSPAQGSQARSSFNGAATFRLRKARANSRQP